jgi:hypothetical protein
MKDTDSSSNNLVVDEVQVDLDVFSVLMLHRFGREIVGTHIVTAHKCSSL